MMRDVIIVCGGAGYIGSHVCKALHDAGYYPVVYDNLSGGYASAVRWGALEVGDLRDKKSLSRVFERYKPAGVLMLAGLIAAGESVTKPLEYWDNNFHSLINLVEACIKFEVRNVVFSSTAAVYHHDEKPLSEEAKIGPINPYGESKLASELFLKSCIAAYGLKVVILRYFNAAGADVESGLGEAHEPETHLIPLGIRAILSGESFRVFGNDYSTEDGTCVRDYIHVKDLAIAHVKALEYLLGGGREVVFNLGNARGYSVLEVLYAIGKQLNLPVEPDFVGRRVGDPPSLVAKNEKAATILSWVPKYSDLQSIISSAVAWEQHQMKVKS